MDEYYFEQELTNEELSYEFHRLMGIAEAYTGAEALRQKLPPGDYLRAIEMLSRFIQQEQEMREAQLTPLTLEAMKKRVEESVTKDNYYNDERLQRESETDKSGD